MEQVKVLDWLLEIDKEMTISVYNQLPTTAEDCPCSYCKNYVAASTSFPAEFLSLLDDLGVDPSKASEVYEICENENGTHLYGGFYHLVGRIVDGQDVKIPIENTRKIELSPLTKDVKIGFTTDLSLVPEQFSGSILQMEFFGDVLWVIEEE